MSEPPRTRSEVLHRGLQLLTFGVEIECITPAPHDPHDDIKVEVSSSLRSAGLERTAVERPDESTFMMRTETTSDGRVVEKRDAHLNNCWKVMDDSTIKSADETKTGVEVASPVFQFNLQSADKLVTVCKQLLKRGAETNDSTGLHVHIGQSPDFFSSDDVLKIYKAYLKYEPVLNCLLPPSRLWGGCAYKFCKDNRKKVQEVFHLERDTDDAILFGCIDKCYDSVGLWEQFCSDRYVKLNVKNIVSARKTFEFRQFPGDGVNPVTICNWARLLGCLVTCARQAQDISPMPSDATTGARTQEFIEHILDSDSRDEIGFKAWFLWRIHEMDEAKDASAGSTSRRW